MQKLRRGYRSGAFERLSAPREDRHFVAALVHRSGLLDVPDFASEFMTMTSSASEGPNIALWVMKIICRFFPSAAESSLTTLIDEMIVQVVFRLVNDQWVVGPRQATAEAERHFCPPRQLCSILKIGSLIVGHSLDTHTDLRCRRPQAQSGSSVFAKCIPISFASAQLQSRTPHQSNLIVRLYVLSQLLRPQLQERVQYLSWFLTRAPFSPSVSRGAIR